MINIGNYFDDLFLEDATFGLPNWSGADLAIDAFGLDILETHPLGAKGRVTIDGTLNFYGVENSVRVVYEYKGDPKIDGVYDPFTIIDSNVLNTSFTKIFYFCGVILFPLAYIEWTIKCSHFALGCDDLRYKSYLTNL